MIDGPSPLPDVEVMLTSNDVTRYIERVLVPALGYLARQPDFIDEAAPGEVFNLRRRFPGALGTFIEMSVGAEVVVIYDDQEIEMPPERYADMQVVFQETQPDMTDPLTDMAYKTISDEDTKTALAEDDDEGLLQAWRITTYDFTTDSSTEPAERSVAHELRNHVDDVFWSDESMNGGSEQGAEAARLGLDREGQDCLSSEELVASDLRARLSALTSLDLMYVSGILKKLGVPDRLLYVED